MTLTRQPFAWKLAAAAITFVCVLLTLQALRGSEPIPSPHEASISGREAMLPGASTDERVEALQAQVADAPSEPEGYGQLGLAYLAKARESGDPSFYTRAEGIFQEALSLDPGNFTATSGLGALALGRHDFHGALELGRSARRINPTIARNYGVIADAQIELGRYDAAERTLQRWVDLKPELSSYARVSYFRELHGDLPGALEAMRLAVSAGGESTENFSYVETLVGNLHLQAGSYGAAERAYRTVLERDPRYQPAIAGLARLRAGRGELDAAIRMYRGVVSVLPLPEYAIALGEAEEAAGRVAAARRDYELVAAQVELLRANGVDTDVDLALFEADHGNARRAVVLGRRAWRAAPSVRSADAYSWALSAAGRTDAALRMSREAMRLGSRDPSFLYHAGMIAARAGRASSARDLLSSLLAQSPRFSPLYAPRARKTLDEIG
jgi:tetratricopeptide (TPR) repeat protein